jgi:Divergent InlB B-repeat domain/S-layer homology domain
MKHRSRLLIALLITSLALAATVPRFVPGTAARSLANATLTLTIVGPGTATGGGSYPVGTVAPLIPTPDPGAVFTGWVIDGIFDGWATQRDVTMNTDHSVVAYFATSPTFTDVPAGSLAYDPIVELTARGIIHGLDPAHFGPNQTTQRAQMAALIARAFPGDAQSGPGIGPHTWAGEDHGNPFTDDGGLLLGAPELWRDVGVLAFHNVAHGYDATHFGPTDPVSYAQTISFITRAMVTEGYWQEVTTDDPDLYRNVPLSSGHRLDLLTYTYYLGAIPDTIPDQNWDVWSQPAPRGWFARALWAALDSYF